MQKFLQKAWAAQGFKAKKRHQAAAQQPAYAKQKKLNQPIAPQGSQPIKNCASRGEGILKFLKRHPLTPRKSR
ncbi:hypothetical protein, partial [Campylobacter sp.]|uniref:hypothetical protein n=1 Tax=Campylobacter sp. TaxID=205 RepID=UPI002AA8A325